MNMNDYQVQAMRTASGLDDDELILNGVLGLSGESGECSDIVKKAKFQGHDLDKESLIEELGDVLWYCAILAEGLGVDLSEVAEENIDKLHKRYPKGFDKARSMNRALKTDLEDDSAVSVPEGYKYEIAGPYIMIANSDGYVTTRIKKKVAKDKKRLTPEQFVRKYNVWIEEDI